MFLEEIMQTFFKHGRRHEIFEELVDFRQRRVFAESDENGVGAGYGPRR